MVTCGSVTKKAPVLKNLSGKLSSVSHRAEFMSSPLSISALLLCRREILGETQKPIGCGTAVINEDGMSGKKGNG